ncbi:MAG: AAA family ATPase [Candidatus Aenigmatarchaeota archaeon]
MWARYQGIRKISRNRYKKIFFLEQLQFQRDYVRIENEETVKKLNQLLLETYKNLGYNIVHIPVSSVEKRVRLIFIQFMIYWHGIEKMYNY